MGYGCRHNDSIVIEKYDLDGVANVLARRVGALHPADVDGQSYYAGAFNALLTLLEHEWKNQVEFFTIFDALWDAPQADDEEEANDGVV